jgi:predicted nucleic acid-binding protein
MSFLLDTNILSAHLRRPSALAHRFIQYSGRLYTSSIALAELYVWAYRRPDPRKALKNIDELLEDEVRLLDFDRECANEFGRIRIDLMRQGIEVPTADLMIGSVASIYAFTVVTHNVVDFQRIPGLRIEDWLSP